MLSFDPSGILGQKAAKPSRETGRKWARLRCRGEDVSTGVRAEESSQRSLKGIVAGMGRVGNPKDGQALPVSETIGAETTRHKPRTETSGSKSYSNSNPFSMKRTQQASTAFAS